MTIQVHMLTLGMVQTNCFIAADTKTRDAIIIDPAAEPERILEIIEKEGYTVRRILATHAHFDHVLASRQVKRATGAPFHLHEKELGQLTHMQSLAQMFGVPVDEPAAEPDGMLDEGDVIEAGAMRLETFFTPGHSPGHVIFVMRNEKIVFGGDCIFQGSIGRTDLPGGSLPVLMQSIFTKIMPLNDDYTLHVGHGPSTTIGAERRSNPFIQAYQRED